MQKLSAHAQAALELADQIAEFYADPYGFVLFAYPWGEEGTSLARETGPDEWQTEFLNDLGKEVRERGFDGITAVEPIKMAAASGHGIGKSTMMAWVANWIMSTRPFARGTVTANTAKQLETKTWAAIQKWTKLSITRSWFVVTSELMYHKDHKESWFCAPQTCKEENSEAFAGQHAKDSTSFYLIDEGSAVPDAIFEVADGGLTDGEPMEIVFGNPTRNSGRFYRACFGSEKDKWNHRAIDSRTSNLTNKKTIAEWIETYGEDSDFVRVRVKGQPPSASELQFIDATRVYAAQKRIVEVLADEPLIAGFDVSGGGAAWNVIRFRRGHDARSIPPIRIPGEAARDRSVLIGIASEVMREKHQGHMVAAMFVDSAFGAPIVERLHTLNFKNVIEVNFGATSTDHHQANQRAFMWSRMKDWLQNGAIDLLSDLEVGLTGPGYHINKSNKLVLESKQDMQKRGEASPDDADALALTFAQKVAPKKPVDEGFGGGSFGSGGGWMG